MYLLFSMIRTYFWDRSIWVMSSCVLYGKVGRRRCITHTSTQWGGVSVSLENTVTVVDHYFEN